MLLASWAINIIPRHSVPPSPTKRRATMSVPKRLRVPRPGYRSLLILLIPLSMVLLRPMPNTSQPSKHTLPIHQISLTRAMRQSQTTNIASSIALPPNKVLPYIHSFANDAVLFLTAPCLQYPSNTRELLYLALLHHDAPAITPNISSPQPHTLSHILPIMLRARALKASDTLEQALSRLHSTIFEFPSIRATSACHIFKSPFDRVQITKRCSNHLPSALYGTGDERLDPPPLSRLDFVPAAEHTPTVLFVTPWLQMGGSEQSMFHLAEYAKTRGHRTAFVVTQPLWGETNGTLSTMNDWLPRAYDITDHVYDSVKLGRYDRRAQILRYVLEALQPAYIIMSNSRLFYQLLPMVRGIAKDSIIADYNHMVHKDWRGGGMPRYGANNTRFVDAHFAASDNVTNAIRGWVREQGYNQNKVKTCYIGADMRRIHSGLKKLWVRRQTRARLGVRRDQILVLFAGRFVLDKGVDVLARVVQTLRDDNRFKFLAVGSGPMAELVRPLHGANMVVMDGASNAEMSNYYAAGDVLLLPSVKEGIALVLYEAMANGLLVITTDVGGQRELVREGTGVLLRRGPTEEVAEAVLRRLRAVASRRGFYSRVAANGTRAVRERFTSEDFCACVFGALVRREADVVVDDDVVALVGKVLKEERKHGIWLWRTLSRGASGVLTVGVVAGCGDAAASARSVRSFGVDVRIGGFEDVVRGVDTELTMILPAGYAVEGDLQRLVDLVRAPHLVKTVFDVVGVASVAGERVGRLGRVQGAWRYCSVERALAVDEVYNVDVVSHVFVVRTEKLREVASSASHADVFVAAFERGWTVGYVNMSAVEIVCSCDRCDAVEMDDVERTGDCGVTAERLRQFPRK